MLTANAMRVFQFLAERPEATVAEISDSLALRATQVETSRAELARHGLIGAAHVGSDALIAIAPDVALAGLVDEKERRILDLQRDVASMRSTLLPLGPMYREARGQMTKASHIEVLDDLEVGQKLLLDLGRQATREVLMMNAGAGSKVELHDASDEKDLDLLARGVIRRDIWHDRRRDHLASRRSVEKLVPAGAEIRTLPVIPCRAFIFDRRTVLFARNVDVADFQFIVVREHELVSLMVELFDAAWQVATPFVIESADEADTAADDDGELTVTQRTILRGLASGLTDEAVASRLGISVRTCRRHIAGLFELLGADSRFQAGALAAARGWL